MIRLGVEGLTGLLQAMTLGGRVRRAASRGLVRAADGLVEDIRAAAPVDKGELRGSVRATPGKDGTIAIEAGGPATTTVSPAGVEYDHALAVEFGNERVPARPFFYPTIRAKRGEVDRVIRDEVERELEKG